MHKNILQFLYRFTCGWILGHDSGCCCEHLCRAPRMDMCFQVSGANTRSEAAGLYCQCGSRFLKNSIFLKKDFCLFIHGRHRERQRHRQREKQAPCREPDVGLNPRSPGSRPGLQAALNCCATGAAPESRFFFFKNPPNNDKSVNQIILL